MSRIVPIFIVSTLLIAIFFLLFFKPSELKDYKKEDPKKESTKSLGEEIDQILDETPFGNIVYNDPEKVPLYGIAKIEVVLSSTIPIGDLETIIKSDIEAEDKIVSEPIKIGRFMEARLTGNSSLLVTDLTPARQHVRKKYPTKGLWQVEGLQKGNHTLTLIVSIIEKHNDKEGSIYYKVFNRNLEVFVSSKIDYWYEIYSLDIIVVLVGTLMLYLLSLILNIPAIGMIINIFKKHKPPKILEQKTNPSESDITQTPELSDVNNKNKSKESD